MIAEAAGATVLRGSTAGYPGVSVIAANQALFPSLISLLDEARFRIEDPAR